MSSAKGPGADAEPRPMIDRPVGQDGATYLPKCVSPRPSKKKPGPNLIRTSLLSRHVPASFRGANPHRGNSTLLALHAANDEVSCGCPIAVEIAARIASRSRQLDAPVVAVIQRRSRGWCLACRLGEGWRRQGDEKRCTGCNNDRTHDKSLLL